MLIVLMLAPLAALVIYCGQDIAIIECDLALAHD
jgi:hypothetical protein